MAVTPRGEGHGAILEICLHTCVVTTNSVDYTGNTVHSYDLLMTFSQVFPARILVDKTA